MVKCEGVRFQELVFSRKIYRKTFGFVESLSFRVQYRTNAVMSPIIVTRLNETRVLYTDN